MTSSHSRSKDVVGPPGSTRGLTFSLALRLAIILVAHFLIDLYSAIFPSILGVVEARCDLSPDYQTPFLMVMIGLMAGGSQPFCAMMSDRYDSRAFGGVGVALMGVCACAIGYATGFKSLLLLLVVGYCGAGMFHPSTASAMGQLSHRNRSAGMSLFFLFGMAGGAVGSFWAPRYVVEHGLTNLIYFAPYAVIGGLLLHFSIGKVAHRGVGHQTFVAEASDLSQRWRMIRYLYFATVLRSFVYTITQFMYVRWVQSNYSLQNPNWNTRDIADRAAPWVGDLNTSTIFGMGVGALVVGMAVRAGRERWAMIWMPIAFAPSLLVLPQLGHHGSCVMGFLAGFGFGSLAPLSLSVAQRLLPHRTSLASALMLGGAWAVAAFGPQIAQWIMPHIGISGVFWLATLLMIASGLLAMPLRIAGYENTVPVKALRG